MTNLSIGIPAYNEEANIKNLLVSLLAQKNRNFVLKEIIIVSDGSSDGTIKEVQSIIDTRIRLFDQKDRKGQAIRQNEIMHHHTGDALVLLNADILPGDDHILEELVDTMATQHADLVCANIEPLLPKTFVEKLAYFGTTTWKQMLNTINTDSLLHRCNGAARLFTRKLVEGFVWPSESGAAEDRYSYFYALSNGYKVGYAKDAVVYYRLPSTLHDYTKQMKRFMGMEVIMDRYFDKSLTAPQDPVTGKDKIKALIRSLLTHSPLTTIPYVLLQIYVRFATVKNSQSSTWDVSASTKKLV